MNSFHPQQISFNDPAGFIFERQGIFYRQVGSDYATHYDFLMSSGLYGMLVDKNLLLPHEEIKENFGGSGNWYKILLPRQIKFVSYPYEWCFDQLKDAALTTLQILKLSVSTGLILKDASPFNIQFLAGRPISIDTLSFEKYDSTKPWVAYRQFCQTFLYPLLLGHYLGVDAQKWLLVYPNGITSKMTSNLLPAKSRFSLNALLHVFLHNGIGRHPTGQQERKISFSRTKMDRLIDHLEAAISRLSYRQKSPSIWQDYYEQYPPTGMYLSDKLQVFSQFICDIKGSLVLDLGCNLGYFSRILAAENNLVIAADTDSPCINALYLSLKKEKNSNIIPCCIDLSNPSPAGGVESIQRQSFGERAKADLVCALALVHHIVLGANIPMYNFARLLADLSKDHLIVEFVGIEDEKAALLISRKSTYHQPYTADFFENQFLQFFDIIRKQTVLGTVRIMYKMKKKQQA